jgi:hypothetical protein
MEVPKDRVLDQCCDRIADHRATINEAVQAEAQDKARALARMQEKGYETYKSHGVELVHTHTDKLRVRLVDDDEGAVAGEQGDLGEAEAAAAEE